MPGTVTRHRPRKSGGERRRAELTLALEAQDPFAPPERVALDDFDVVTLGRGERRATTRGPGRQLLLEVADSWMSTRHARLVRVAGQWYVEDLGSKNGTLVGGVEERRAALRDGDVIELGSSFFLYREARTPLGPDAEPPHPALVTRSSDLAADLDRLARVAGADVSVVLRGETGTGKEILAHAVHDLSARSGRFVAVNCGALVETLAQSELFGYRRGAFSGATEDRMGLVRAADQGTLFLDEIGDMPAATQAVLLRVLQEREVKPLGATEPAPIDVRVVSATHRDLEAMIADGSFRADLYARLAGFDLTLPPLRQRREDIGLLVARLLERYGVGRGQVSFESEAARALFVYDWPLNVRELEKAISRAVALAEAGRIGLAELPPALQQVGDPRSAASERAPTASSRPPAPLDEEDRRWRDRLVEALERHDGNVSAAARDLDKDRKQLHRWIRRFGIDLGRFRGA
jgi:sigma-54 dependent transcriptional regulator, acetoin dehydrogenase operon transcriptional activator AcoR